VNSDEKRRLRELRAIEIIKAIRRNPDPHAEKPFEPHDDPPKPLRHTESPGSNPTPTGYIYFVYCAGRIKIGYATEVADRMSGIGTSSPFPITLLMTIRGSLEDEKLFHDLFEDDRVNREWFQLSLYGDLHEFLWRHLGDDGFELWEGAQHDCRDMILSAAADVVSLTGGNPEGQALRRAPFPGTFEVDDIEIVWEIDE
jgi:hypothetical protein